MSRFAHARCVLVTALSLVSTTALLAQAAPGAGNEVPCCTVTVVPFAAGVPSAQQAAARLARAFAAGPAVDGSVTWLTSRAAPRPHGPEGGEGRAKFMFAGTVYVLGRPDSLLTRVDWRVFDSENGDMLLLGNAQRPGAFADSSIINEIRREVRTRLPEAARTQRPRPFYGYGATLEQAAGQCRAQRGLSSTDTTRAADGGIQMLCRRAPASACAYPNTDTLRAEAVAMTARQRPGYEFGQLYVDRVHPEVALLWGETRYQSLGTTGWRTEVFVCDGGVWRWARDFGTIHPRAAVGPTTAPLRAEPARPDSSLVAGITIPGEGTIEVSLNPDEHTLEGIATPIAVTAISVTGVINRVAVSPLRASSFLNRTRPTRWQATADSAAAWLARPATRAEGRRDADYFFAGLVGEGDGNMVVGHDGEHPDSFLVEFKFGGPDLRLDRAQVDHLFDAIRRAIGRAAM